MNEEYARLLTSLPYGKEFLFIDEIISLNKHALEITTSFHYSILSPIVKAHFAGMYVAGSLLTEQVCQTALLLLNAISESSPSAIFLGKVTSDYFKPVMPGTDVFAEVKLIRQQPPAFLFKGVILAGNEKSAIIQAAAYIKDEC